ncbi:MAG: uroporphyrinogen decarboxylase family protein [Planctomycetota bacterium]
MTLSPKENLLACIRHQSPDYVPMANEKIEHSFQFDGNFRQEDWTDLWNVEWEVGLQGTVPFPKGNPLPSLDKLSDYPFPSSDQLIFTNEMKTALKGIDRTERLVFGQLTYLLFERAWAIMGMENFLMAMATHPDEVRVFLHQIATFARNVFDRYLELGVDGISFSEDLGTQRALMMSPKMFRDFLLPEYRFIFENTLNAGKIVNFHSCGCVEAISGDLAKIGVTILNPIQKRANDLGRIKSSVAGKMALKGGIDSQLILLGTPQDVSQQVADVMDTLMPGGGYICGPDQWMPDYPQENLDALYKTAKRIGRYV